MKFATKISPLLNLSDIFSLLEWKNWFKHTKKLKVIFESHNDNQIFFLANITPACTVNIQILNLQSLDFCKELHTCCIKISDKYVTEENLADVPMLQIYQLFPFLACLNVRLSANALIYYAYWKQGRCLDVAVNVAVKHFVKKESDTTTN